MLGAHYSSSVLTRLTQSDRKSRFVLRTLAKISHEKTRHLILVSNVLGSCLKDLDFYQKKMAFKVRKRLLEGPAGNFRISSEIVH